MNHSLALPCICIATPRQAVVNSLRQPLGVAERVADAEGELGVFVTACVTDQRPAGAVGLPKKIREVCSSVKPIFFFAVADAFSEFRDSVQHCLKVSFN